MEEDRLWAKKERKYGGLVLYVFFWTIWKARNKIAFEDAMLSIQKLKSFFVYFLWAETKLCIIEDPTMLWSSSSG